MSHGVIFKGFKNKLGKFVYKLVFKNEITIEKFLNLEKWYRNDNFEYGIISLHVLLLWASYMLILWIVCLMACLTLLCESYCDGNNYELLKHFKFILKINFQ